MMELKEIKERFNLSNENPITEDKFYAVGRALGLNEFAIKSCWHSQPTKEELDDFARILGIKIREWVSEYDVAVYFYVMMNTVTIDRINQLAMAVYKKMN